MAILSMSENKKKINCPDCEAGIEVKNSTEVGDILECEECGTEVEVVSLDPLKCEELIEEK